jgi:hypothetical protein
MGETLKIAPTESIEILSSDQEALLLEATYLPGKPPPKHLHPEQDEHFEVLEGESAWTCWARSAVVVATGPRSVGVRIRYTPTKSTSDDGLEACSADALAIIEPCSAR